MNPIIVYRDDVDWKQESEAAERYFPCYNSRLKAKSGDLVIARFSALPFYKEQENDYLSLGAKMINSSFEHNYIADLGNWYFDLQEFTPRTWNNLVDLPENVPFVLKGETNSKKFFFKDLMFAKDKKAAIEVYGRLCADSLLQYQKIYIREYIPLETYMIGLQGLPITKEFRFFCYKDRILSGGYYWSSHVDDLPKVPNINEVPTDFLMKIINIVKENTNYYVLDVAKTQSGNWILVELNDGSMSGISENDPDVLYRNLKEALKNDV